MLTGSASGPDGATRHRPPPVRGVRVELTGVNSSDAIAVEGGWRGTTRGTGPGTPASPLISPWTSVGATAPAPHPVFHPVWLRRRCAPPEWADAAALGAPRRHGPVPRRRRAAAPPGAGRAAGDRRRARRPDRAGGGVDGVLRGPRARRPQSGWRSSWPCAAAPRRCSCRSTSRSTRRRRREVMETLRAHAGRGGRGARAGTRRSSGSRPTTRWPPRGRSRPPCSRRPACTARSASATPWSGPRSRPTSASRRASSCSPATTGWR